MEKPKKKKKKKKDGFVFCMYEFYGDDSKWGGIGIVTGTKRKKERKRKMKIE